MSASDVVIRREPEELGIGHRTQNVMVPEPMGTERRTQNPTVTDNIFKSFEQNILELEHGGLSPVTPRGNLRSLNNSPDYSSSSWQHGPSLEEVQNMVKNRMERVTEFLRGSIADMLSQIDEKFHHCSRTHNEEMVTSNLWVTKEVGEVHAAMDKLSDES